MTAKTRQETTAVPIAGADPRLYNEDLPQATKRNWKTYNLFALWMSDVHNVGNYVGRRFQGRVVRTLVRGTTVYGRRGHEAGPVGRLVTPRHSTRALEPA